MVKAGQGAGMGPSRPGGHEGRGGSEKACWEGDQRGRADVQDGRSRMGRGHSRDKGPGARACPCKWLEPSDEGTRGREGRWCRAVGASGRTGLFPQGGASRGGPQAGKGRPDLGARGRPLEDGLWGQGRRTGPSGRGGHLMLCGFGGVPAALAEYRDVGDKAPRELPFKPGAPLTPTQGKIPRTLAGRVVPQRLLCPLPSVSRSLFSQPPCCTFKIPSSRLAQPAPLPREGQLAGRREPLSPC